jgi:hypothetical protein
MGINAKIAKIPFLVLYLMLAGLISFNWIRVILFQKDFEAFRTTQPWDYYLSNFFSTNFGITHKQYFLFAFPVILVCLYLIPKLFAKLMNMDKNSNVKGDNHVAIILILMVAPVALGLHELFDFGWRSYLIPGIILISLFSIWSWADEQKAKKKV